MDAPQCIAAPEQEEEKSPFARQLAVKKFPQLIITERNMPMGRLQSARSFYLDTHPAFPACPAVRLRQ